MDELDLLDTIEVHARAMSNVRRLQQDHDNTTETRPEELRTKGA
jgi:hypothetical protein